MSALCTLTIKWPVGIKLSMITDTVGQLGQDCTVVYITSVYS